MNSDTPAKAKLLLVDDEHDLLHVVSLRLSVAGYEVETASSGAEALSKIPVFRPHVVISDLRMEGMDGLALFDAVTRDWPTLPVIILTAHGTIPDAVEATRRGVFGYLSKPFNHKEMQAQIEAALKVGGGVPADAESNGAWRRAIITRSPALEAVLAEARLVARSDANILIRGQSGTGKELLAQAIHRASQRSSQAFVAVNCSAIPEALIESELFGHRKGAFTGATHDHPGLFQAADGGILFLDEIGDMPLATQAKLLRVLQERQVRPVGGVDSVGVDVRIVSATHRDLDAMVAQGQFREDLYYRLNVVTLALPSLCERREDIPLLARHFLDVITQNTAYDVKGFSPDAMARLIAYDWPGNVRQLFNVVERTVVLATTALIPASQVERALDEAPAELPSLVETREQAEREYISRILTLTEGNVTAAAKLAKRNRTEFYKLLNRHHIDPALFKKRR
ncbi:sigma 54-interacting transcriptional regulator [Acidihalobacter ferrooxydans]|uniref:Two-component system response regulator GlrR n=1 Tax=Acidihalobacter ferrooxydans TaxID=1765967 RepID=A0A1P8UHZ1_9GAMM|nr:sigma 54-interacting transcriptional regulator [Acidihalobacter ferrooxydans]APZ43381.1 two-component system response regulator GlrR [Acidihalobacter ferrooxydans]